MVYGILGKHVNIKQKGKEKMETAQENKAGNVKNKKEISKNEKIEAKGKVESGKKRERGIITILKTFLFLGIGGVLFVMCCYMIRPVDGTRDRVVGFYGLEKNSLDVVTIGSSAFYRYFNSPYIYDKYNIMSYNYCTPGMGCRMYLSSIKEVRETQDPDLYVIDARRYINCRKKGKVSKARLTLLCGNMKYSKNRFDLIRHVEGNLKDPMPMYLDILLYHSAWPDVRLENLKYYKNSLPMDNAGWGNIPTIEVLEEPDCKDITETKELLEIAERELRDLCEYIIENDLKVLFVNTIYQIKPDHKKVSNRIAEILKEYDQQYLEMNDYAQELGINYETDFYNNAHVNCLGARKVSGFFAEYLEENFDIQKNHSDTSVEYWNSVTDQDTQDFKNAYNKISKKAEKKGLSIPALEEFL